MVGQSPTALPGAAGKEKPGARPHGAQRLGQGAADLHCSFWKAGRFSRSWAVSEKPGDFRGAGRFPRSWAISEKPDGFREAMWFPRSWIVSGELSGFWKAGWKPSGPLFTGLRPGMTTALAFFPAAPVKTLGALPPIPCKLLKKFDQNFHALRDIHF